MTAPAWRWLHADEAAAFRAAVHEVLIGALEDAATHGLFDDLLVAIVATSSGASAAPALIPASTSRLPDRGEAAAPSLPCRPGRVARP